jgi:Bacterial SH3 domain
MSFVRIAASAIIFTALSAACATAKPVVTTGDTNLRKAPGTENPVLTLIPKGTTVEVGKCTNGWCQASFDGQDGYLIGQNVGMAAARRPPPRGPMAAAEEVVEEEYEPPVAYGPRVYGPGPYLVGPPGYYGYGPYYRGWGWGGGWRW